MSMGVHGEQTDSTSASGAAVSGYVTRLVIATCAFVAVAVAGAVIARGLLISSSNHDPATAAARSSAALDFVGARDDGALYLGEHPRGVRREFTLSIRNPSDTDSFRIERISTSCTCTFAGGFPVTVPPGDRVEIPYWIDLPGEQTAWEVSLYLFSDKDQPPQSVIAKVSLPNPYPALAAPAPGARIRLPISSVYAGVISAAECYAYPGDAPLFARLDDAGAALVIDPPPAGAQRLEIITTVIGANGESSRFAQYVALAPPPIPETH